MSSSFSTPTSAKTRRSSSTSLIRWFPGRADFVLGHRVGEGRPWHASAGTWLCVACINAVWGTRYRDLGPFRAIRRASLDALGMRDRTWGWTIEMQVKAAEAGLRTLELPVVTRPTVGQSKISGTVTGTAKAATRMLTIIAQLALTRRRRVRHFTGVLSHPGTIVNPPGGTGAAARHAKRRGQAPGRTQGIPHGGRSIQTRQPVGRDTQAVPEEDASAAHGEPLGEDEGRPRHVR
jgi:hypothetical protein